MLLDVQTLGGPGLLYFRQLASRSPFPEPLIISPIGACVIYKSSVALDPVAY
jgi:hypothetical protein